MCDNQTKGLALLSDRLINFLSAVWKRAVEISDNDEQRAKVVNDNILKLHGFPVGVIYPDAINQAIRLNAADSNSEVGNGQQSSAAEADRRARTAKFYELLRHELGGVETAESSDSSDDSQQQNTDKIRKTVSRFIALSRSGQLDAIAGPVGAPENNAGMYRGRITEIDPTKWESRVQPYNSQDNHNMTNITFPSLNDEDGEGGEGSEEEQELQRQLQDALDSGNELDDSHPGEEVSYADPQKPERIFVPIVSESGAPERVRFSLDEDGAISLEPALAAVSEWWKSRTPAQKRYYLERHPNSKYAKAYRAAVAKKKALAKKSAGKGKGAPKIVKDLDQEAGVNEQAHDEAGVEPGDAIEDDLSQEQDSQVDELSQSIEDELESYDEEDGSGDADSEDDEDTEDQKPKPRLDKGSAEKLGQVSKKFGFFKTIGNIAKKKISDSTLGSMSRFMKGTMKEGDKEKVAKGLATAASVLAVVAIGAGVTMLAGPGVLATYLNEFVGSPDRFNFGSGDGDFDFTAESASADGTKTSDSESDENSHGAANDTMSAEDLEKLMKHFTAWMINKAKTEQEHDQEQQA